MEQSASEISIINKQNKIKDIIMNEKITAILTLAIMGIAFWYGFSGANANNTDYDNTVDFMTSNKIIEEENQSFSNEAMDIEIEIDDKENEIISNEFDAKSIEPSVLNNTPAECSLDPSDTDIMAFKEAFKYYRTCNGNKSDFVWNGKLFITSYKEEIIPTIESIITVTDKKKEAEVIEISVSN